MHRLLKNIVEILFMFVLFAICDLTGTEKYGLVLGFTLFFLILGRKERWSTDVLISISLPMVVYLIIGCFNAIIGANISMVTVKTVVFWLLPLLFAFSLYIYKKNDFWHIVDAEFIGSCLAYLAINARFLRYYLKVESIFSFAFGAFFLYYVSKKRWGYAAVAFWFLFITDKRITILSAFVGVMIRLFLKLFRNNKKIVYFIWGSVIALINVYLWLICSGKFEYYTKGIGINTNGRTEMYTQLMEWFEQPVFLVGKGLGIVETLLKAWNIRTFANLHNDLLKFYVELGIIGLILFLLSYVVTFYLAERRFGEEKMCMMLTLSIYSMTLFATDNVSIYILYLIPYYSILFAILSPNQRDNTRKRIKNDRKNNSEDKR